MALPQQTGIVRRAINYAEHQIGTPYVWGGSSPGGFDCSGLVYAAYRSAGYEGIGRTTYDMLKQGVQVDPRHLQPGDLVFANGGAHMALYVGGGQVVSAPHTGADVHQMPLSGLGAIYQVRRLVGGGGGVTPPSGGASVGPGGLPIPHAGDHRQASALNVALLAATLPPVTVGQHQAPTPAQARASLQPAPAMPAQRVPAVPAPNALPPSPVPGQAGQLEGIRKRLLGLG